MCVHLFSVFKPMLLFNVTALSHLTTRLNLISFSPPLKNSGKHTMISSSTKNNVIRVQDNE